MTIFVPGPLRNPLNGSYGHWSKHRRWAKNWRERTHLAILGSRQAGPEDDPPEVPKRVVFDAHTHNRWDDDGLRAGLKPVRDALKDAGIIHDDGPTSGHEFIYTQRIDRTNRGVSITWELR